MKAFDHFYLITRTRINCGNFHVEFVRNVLFVYFYDINMHEMCTKVVSIVRKLHLRKDKKKLILIKSSSFKTDYIYSTACMSFIFKRYLLMNMFF